MAARDKASGLSRYVANALEHSIDRHMRVDQGAVGRAEFRVDGEILEAGSGRERLLLNVRLFSGDERLQLFQEHVARSSAPLLDPVDPPEGSSPPVGCGTDREVANRLLPDGYTLGDWRLLATDRLKRRDHIRLLVEAKAHLRDHCDWSGAREVLDLAVSGLAAGIRLSDKGEARRALARVAEIAGSAGEHPVLLGLRARAHRLLGEYVQEEEAHRRWLRLASESHPERRETLLALMRARSAVSDGERFSALLGRPFSATAKEESAGWTDLHYAAAMNLPGAIQALVDAGMAADVRLRDDSSRFGEALQGILIGLGHEEFKGWNPEGETPLMIAAVAKAHEAAAALLDAGADIHAKNNDGETPLHYAARRNALETAEWLVGRGADIKAKDNVRQETPLHWAARRNAREIAELAGRARRRHQSEGQWRRRPLCTLRRHIATPGRRRNGWLGAAPTSTRRTMAARPHCTLRRGATPGRQRNGWSGAAPTSTRRTMTEKPPLHEAAFRNALETAEWLASRGADIHAKDDRGETPLHEAAYRNARETAEWLAGRGADIHAKDNGGKTPLHLAAWRNARKTAEWLVGRGADIHAKDKYGQTPLHEAARGKRPGDGGMAGQSRRRHPREGRSWRDPSARGGISQRPGDGGMAGQSRRRHPREGRSWRDPSARGGISQRPGDGGMAGRARRRHPREGQVRPDSAARGGAGQRPRDGGIAGRARRRYPREGQWRRHPAALGGMGERP